MTRAAPALALATAFSTAAPVTGAVPMRRALAVPALGPGIQQTCTAALPP